MDSRQEEKTIFKIQINQIQNTATNKIVAKQKQELKGLQIIQKIQYLLEMMNMVLKKFKRKIKLSKRNKILYKIMIRKKIQKLKEINLKIYSKQMF